MSAPENPENGATSPILAIGDELLLSIMELLSVPDVLSCSLVNNRLHAVAIAAMIPYRNALERYGLEYRPYNSSEQPCPDRPLCELLDLITTLNRNWLHLRPIESHRMRIINATDDIYFFRDHVIIDRTNEEDSDDSDDEDEGEMSWELEVFKYGDEPPAAETDSNDPGVEIEEDGTVVEEIDPETHGIDVDAIETDEEDEDEDAPENSDNGGSTAESEEQWVEMEGLYSIAQFHTGNSFMSAYKADVSQDLVITGEQWLKGKVKKASRRIARGGLNFMRKTYFLRCLTLSELKPHPASKSHLGAINVNYLCTENKEDFDEPVDICIRGPLVAFTVMHTLLDKVVVINWKEPTKPYTIRLNKELYMDKYFIANDLLLVLVCPITDTDLVRRSLDESTWFAPREGKLKLHLYYLGPNKNGVTSPCLLRTLLYPTFNTRWRVDVESGGKILPQSSDSSSKVPKDAPSLSDGLPHRTKPDAGVIGVSVNGVLVRGSSGNDDDDDDDEVDSGVGWIIDLVVHRSHLLEIAQNAMAEKDKSKLGTEISWQDWAGVNGEDVRLFPHSDKGWLGNPKLYECNSYRMASITPLKRGDTADQMTTHEDRLDENRQRKKVVAADRRLDVIDFCPGRLADVREALDARKKQLELENSPVNSKFLEDGMFGVAPGTLLEGDGSEITLVEAASVVEGGPFLHPVTTCLPYILSRFDLERGRKDDGGIGLPESVWMTGTQLVFQLEAEEDDNSMSPCFDRYTFL